MVKAFGSRIDLFSAMIVGPAGTPYEDYPLFFDIQLPAEYPSLPPKMYYNSFASEMVNPNFYTSGNMCLSLLNTWRGDREEMWEPGTSSLLQILVSIQGRSLCLSAYLHF